MTFKFKSQLYSLGLLMLFMGLILSACSEESIGDSDSNNDNANNDGDGETVTLKLAHQWAATEDGEGDYRSILAERFAEEVEKESEGSLKVEVYPANSLVGTDEQYEALQKGSLDLAIWAPFYASGKEHDFSISLMPGIIDSLEQAWRWKDDRIGEEIEDMLTEKGVNTLIWTWAPLTAATKGDQLIENPQDVSGLKFRGAGGDSEHMLQDLGAGIVSMPSSELYSALQTGVLDGTLTSYSSFMSYQLYEVVDNFMYLGDDYAVMYAMMPLVMSENTFEKKLTDEQREIIKKVSEDLQDWVIDAVDEDNAKVVQVFKDNDVNVYELDGKEQVKLWNEAAEPVIEEFANSSDRAKKLIEAAQELRD